MLLKTLYPSSFHHRFTVIQVLLALTLALVSITSSATPLNAQDEPVTIQKTTCLSALGYDELDLLKADLLLQAKKEAVNELFGELITASTTVEEFVVTSDQILASSVGFVRVTGNPEYFHGEELASVCVVIDTYVTEEDRQKLEPMSLTSSEQCIPDENLSLRELKQIAENRAVLSALHNRYPELAQQEEENVLLLLKDKRFDGGLDSRTGAYCTSVSGQVFPIEIQTFLSQVTQASEDAPLQELVISRRCNIRSGPGTDFEIVGTANTGERLIATGANEDNSWWQVEYDNQVAWVSELCADTNYSEEADIIASEESTDGQCVIPELETVEYSGGSQMLESGKIYHGFQLKDEDHIYIFRAERRVPIVFQHEQGPGIKAFIKVTDSLGNQVASNNNAHGLLRQFVFIPAADGDYFIKLEHWGGNGDHYYLRILDPNDVARIQPGAECSGQLFPDLFEEFAFRGQSNIPIRFRITQGPGLQAFVKIYDWQRNELTGLGAHGETRDLVFTPRADENI